MVRTHGERRRKLRRCFRQVLARSASIGSAASLDQLQIFGPSVTPLAPAVAYGSGNFWTSYLGGNTANRIQTEPLPKILVICLNLLADTASFEIEGKRKLPARVS